MNQRLLIADDDNEIRELLEFDLSHSGYDVESFVWCDVSHLDY